MEEARQIIQDFKNKVNYSEKTCKISDDVSFSLSWGNLVLIRKINFNGTPVSVILTKNEGMAIYIANSPLVPLEKCSCGYIAGPVKDKVLAPYATHGIMRILKCTQLYNGEPEAKYLVAIDSKVKLDFDDVPDYVTAAFKKTSFLSFLKSLF